jgi:hypothetical protein
MVHSASPLPRHGAVTAQGDGPERDRHRRRRAMDSHRQSRAGHWLYRTEPEAETPWCCVYVKPRHVAIHALGSVAYPERLPPPPNARLQRRPHGKRPHGDPMVRAATPLPRRGVVTVQSRAD